MGSPPAKATMQLLHQTCRSRIDRLNVAAVTGGSLGKYGDQQRFSASTRSAMSSVRQNLYELKPPDVRLTRFVPSMPRQDARHFPSRGRIPDALPSPSGLSVAIA